MTQFSILSSLTPAAEKDGSKTVKKITVTVVKNRRLNSFFPWKRRNLVKYIFYMQKMFSGNGETSLNKMFYSTKKYFDAITIIGTCPKFETT